MADRFKGITIEIDGNTTKLEAALKKVDRQTKAIDRELRKVDKALKFNPTSVNLWSEKQRLLNEQVENTSKKLKDLQLAQKKMDAEGVSENSEEYRNLQREIAITETDLKRFQKELNKIRNVKLKALGEQFKQVGDKMKAVGQNMTRYVTAPLAAGFAASIKAATSYGDAVAKVSTIADETQVPIKQLSSDILNLSNQSGKSATELAEATYQALSASVETKNVSNFVKQATGLAKAGFLETAGAVDVLTTIINAYGKSAEDADMIANMLIQTQNDGKTTVDELAESMGNVIPTASALNVPLEQLSAAYVMLTKQGINTNRSTTAINALFTELSKSGSKVSKILQEKTGKTFGQLMKDGWSLGDILKVLSDNVNGDGEAFKNLFGNVRAGQGALALLNGGIDEFNAETEKMLNSTGNVDNALNDLATSGAAMRKALNQIVNVGIQVGDVLAPYIQKAAELIQILVDKFNSLSPETQKLIVIIAAVVAAVGPVLALLGTITSGIGSLISFIGGLSPALLGIAGWVAVAVAAGVLLYKNWDKIKAFAIEFKDGLINTFNGLKNGVTTTFNNIKNAIVKPMQTAVDKVKAVVEKIKSWFPINIGNIFKNVKLPHFKLSGKFSLNPPSVPKLDIDWYKNGGIFDSPTVIGIGDTPRGGEAAVPLDPFWKKMDKIAEAATGSTVINININGSNKDPREIAEEVRKVLIKEVNGRRLAWQ